METIILLIECKDKRGIVANVAKWICDHKGNVIRSDQHTTDPFNGIFFMRIEFALESDNANLLEKLSESFAPMAKALQADWRLFAKSQPLRMGILVSKYDHCLFDILYHWRSQDIRAHISCIISNHEGCRVMAERHNIPYHYLPMTSENKAEQEQKILALVKDSTDFLVLARYMQILSPNFIEHYQKDIINIHHSFLPAFMGANPYQQAYDRGVKVIGATAHFVTANLDEGPIIAQSVETTSHRDDVTTLKRKGKNLEKFTLVKAISSYLEHRIIRYQNKTIVFD